MGRIEEAESKDGRAASSETSRAEVTLPWFIVNPKAAIDAYVRPERFVVLDYETDTLDKGSAINPDNHIVLACWLVVDRTTVTKKHAWSDEYGLDELAKDIGKSQFVVAHNAKFELQWLRRSGLELRDILVFDTMLAEWVIAGNRLWSLSLDDTAKRYGVGVKQAVSASMIHMGVDTRDIPREWLLPYCYQDCFLSLEIYRKQIEILQRDNLLHLVLTRNLTCAALADIEFAGCELDADKVLQEHAITEAEFSKLEVELRKLTGGINLNSGVQLAKYLFETLQFTIPRDHKGKEILTPAGKPKTDSATLSLMQPKTEEQAKFLSLYKIRNKLDSLLTKNLDFFQGVVKEKAAVFYGNLQQGFTGTHRLSSSGRPLLFSGEKKTKGAQLQNLPRQYKGLFTAHDDDYIVAEFDGSQLEFRVAADMGHDEQATSDIVNGEDVHSNTRDILTAAGHPLFQGIDKKEGRQRAKPHTFAPLYGAMGKIKAEQDYVKWFRERYNGIYQTQHEWCLQVLDKGYMVSPYGMRFYWPGTKMSRSGYIDNTTAISNYSIQGFATAEIIPIALVHFWQKSKNMPIVIFNTIHDSIVTRLKKGYEERAEKLAKQCFTTDVYNWLQNIYGYSFTVPLGVGMKFDKHWGEGKDEISYDVWPDGREIRKVKQ